MIQNNGLFGKKLHQFKFRTHRDSKYASQVRNKMWSFCTYNKYQGLRRWNMFNYFRAYWIVTYIGLWGPYLIPCQPYVLKVHKHKIILNFFYLNPILISSKIFAVTEHTRNQFFFRYPTKIFLQKVHFGPIRWVPKRVFKISIFYSRYLHFN
jgi:hypothetical protein